MSESNLIQCRSCLIDCVDASDDGEEMCAECLQDELEKKLDLMYQKMQDSNETAKALVRFMLH